MRPFALQLATIHVGCHHNIALSRNGGITVKGLPKGIIDVNIVDLMIWPLPHRQGGFVAKEEQLEGCLELGTLFIAADI